MSQMGPLDVWLNITDLFSSLHCLHFIFSPGLLFTSLSLCKLICYPSQILILAKPLSHCFHLCFSVLCFPLLSLLHTLHTGGWPCLMGAVAPIGWELRDKRFYLQKWLWSSYVVPSCLPALIISVGMWPIPPQFNSLKLLWTTCGCF